MRYLLMFRSLTYAQRGDRALSRAGITGTLTRMPRSVSVRGCSYGILISPAQYSRAMDVLAAAGALPERVFIRDADGSLREADHDMA